MEGHAKEEQFQSVILFLLYPSIADKKKKKEKVGHTPKDYLQVYNMTAQHSTSPLVKLNKEVNV